MEQTPNPKLMPHQEETVRRMEKFEKKQKKMVTGDIFVNTSYGFLSNPVGSGKTRTMLQVIRNNRYPLTEVHRYTRRMWDVLMTGGIGDFFKINTNLVICPKPLVSLWENEATVMDVPSLVIDAPKKLRAEILGEALENLFRLPYSVLIVSTELFGPLITELCSVFSTGFTDLIFQRVILDDIHSTAKWTEPSRRIHGAFTWFINATPEAITIQRLHRLTKIFGALGVSEQFKVYSASVALRSTEIQYTPPPVIRHTKFYRDHSLASRLSTYIPPEVLELINSGDYDGAYRAVAGNDEDIVELRKKPLHVLVMDKYRSKLDGLIVRRSQIVAFGDPTTAIDQRILEVRNSIQSLEDRLKEMDAEKFDCPICFEETDKCGVVVTKCCHNVFCKSCIAQTILRGGNCPLCRSKICMNDLYSLQSDGMAIDLDITKLPVDTRGPPQIPATPMEALKSIVESNPTGKFVVFAPSEGSASSYVNYFADTGINISDIRGSSSRIQKTLHDFEHGNLHIIFLCSKTSNAGLNFQFATDVVFIGGANASDYTQSVGRVLRYPRTEAVPVHMIVRERDQ